MRLISVVLLAICSMCTGAASFAKSAHSVCEDLRRLAVAHKEVLSATVVAGGTFQAPNGERFELPAFCRVRGLARPSADSRIHFEVWLPTEKWNGRFYQHGEADGGGNINYAALATALRSGAAAAATDDGHVRPQNINTPSDWDSLWALNHPERIIDEDYRALAITTERARTLIQAYYGAVPRYSYFEGCSWGGGYALKAAQRFPQKWDGILAGSPTNNITGYYVANAWNISLWMNQHGRLPETKLPAIQRAALAACKPQARIIDGIPTDPRFCSFDPATLACHGPETDSCLTPAQITTLRKIYDGPRNPRTHEQLYPGFPPTMESWWAGTLTSGRLTGVMSVFNGEPAQLQNVNDFYRNFVFFDPQWDLRRFDFDAGVVSAESRELAGQSVKSVMDAVDPDLSAFERRGGKLLMYFGWGDEYLTPMEGIRYYESVAQASGGIERTRDFFRLFMVPGMTHCVSGPGANSFGQDVFGQGQALRNDADHHILRALEAWVEKGRRPERIVAAKYVNDEPQRGVAFTRPVCPYPQVAAYRGSGAITDASNFQCTESVPESRVVRR